MQHCIFSKVKVDNTDNMVYINYILLRNTPELVSLSLHLLS